MATGILMDYDVLLIHADRQQWADDLRHALVQEIRRLDLQEAIQIQFPNADALPSVPERPIIAVYLGSEASARSQDCRLHIERAQALDILVLPVVEESQPFTSHVPESLRSINAWLWKPGLEAPELGTFILEQLGITERQRLAFISYRRDDALLMGEQLYDQLAHRRFSPFLDRFDVVPAARVQQRIKEALEDVAFLLLIESPMAHQSQWVFYEVDYALKHHMAVLKLRWPTTTQGIPNAVGLPEELLGQNDIDVHSGMQKISQDALPRIMARIESEHASGLLRRRRNLLNSVKDLARAAGRSHVELPHWRVLLTDSAEQDHPSQQGTVVGVTTRLPRVEDVHDLDEYALGLENEEGGPLARVLVHAADYFPPPRQELLSWAIGHREFTVVPESSLAGIW